MKNTPKILIAAIITLSSLHAAPILLDTKGVPPDSVGGDDVPVTRKNSGILLWHARAVQQAIVQATLSAQISKNKSPEWTSSYKDIESLKKYLIEEGYLEKDIGEIFFQHLKIARVTESDPSNTILVASDNYLDSKNSKTSELTGNAVIVFTKGGGGGILPDSQSAGDMYSLPKTEPVFLKNQEAEQGAAANP